MRITVLFLVVGYMHLSANVLSQTVTLLVEKQPLTKVFEIIGTQTGYQVVYSERFVRSAKPITITANQMPLTEFLETILTPESLSFQIKEKTVLIRRQTTSVLEIPEHNNPIVQQRTVIGQVTDVNGKPLVGVTVRVSGTNAATTTDTEGRYEINIPENGRTLNYSFMGFETVESDSRGKSVINVSLQTAMSDLDEVVVVGYGVQKKSDLTGSLASINANEISAFPAASPAQSLAGRAAGVHVLPKSGSPGSSVSVRVRGTNSIMGSNEPLYVVDGFPFTGNPDMINNNDIESIEVLKDASATAIYGSRGANGVVLISTKKGKQGKTLVEYTGRYQVNTLRKKLDLLNGAEYARMINKMFENDGDQPFFENPDRFGEGTDWQDLIFRRAPLINQSVSASGGNEKTVFSTSVGNYSEQGIIRNSDYSKYSVNSNLSHKLNPYIEVNLNTNFSKVQSSMKNSTGGGRGNSMIAGMIGAPPSVAAYDEFGDLTKMNQSYSYISDAIKNPLNYIDERSDDLSSNKLLLNGAIVVKPMAGLTFRFSGGLETNDQRTDGYTTKKFFNSNGVGNLNYANHVNLLSENTVNYAFRKNDVHDFTVLAGFTYQSFVGKGSYLGGSGFASDVLGADNLGSADVFAIPSSYFSDWSLLSYLSRVNYSLMDKYLFTASVRADGSSRYSAGNKWAVFPSGAFAWRMKNEEFLKDVDAISDLKFRVGYGESGSTAISPYQTLNMLVAEKAVLDKELVTAYSPSSRLPSNLKWETTSQIDLGIDLALWNNRFRITADYYIKNTRDLLNNVQIPSSTGYTNSIRNVGKIQNRGLELGIEADVFDREFSWQVSGNISFNRNKVVKLNESQVIRGSNINITVLNDFINILKEGEPVGIFYGYMENGYDDNGRITYERDDPTKELSFNDKRRIGNPNPKFTGGINNSFAYKGFDLNVFVIGSYGNDVFNLSKAANMDYLVGLNKTKDILYDSWSPQNTTAKNPRLSKSNPVNVSDRFVEDGSFLKVKNIQLGYNIPFESGSIKWISKARVYVSGQDLITLSTYSWFDPEVNSLGNNSSINQGIDHLSYPTFKSVSMGIMLNF